MAVSKKRSTQTRQQTNGGASPVPQNAAHAKKHAAARNSALQHKQLSLHRITGPISWSPASVISMAGSRDGSLCAVAREDGRVDLYGGATTSTSAGSAASSTSTPSPSDGFFFIKSIPSVADASPSSIVMVDCHLENKVRMFVGGMDGTITELDSARRQPRLVCDSYGGAVWCLAAVDDTATVGAQQHETSEKGAEQDRYSHRLAAACDDGSVKVFGVEADGSPGVTLIKSFLPVEGRVLCVAWDASHKKKRVVSGGSDGCVHVWDAVSGVEEMRITVGGGDKTENSDVLCVWTVMVLRDGTIVSGDSAGQVCFWDGRFGTMLAKFNPNGSDVLALETSEDGNLVFSSGIDPRIAIFRRVAASGADGDNEWAYLSSKQEHVLDVRALCVCGGRLLSGGNDALVVSHSVGRFLKEHPRRIDSVPARPLVSGLGRGERNDALVMVSGSGSAVNIWELRANNELANLARLERSRRAELTAVATSSDGRFVAFGDIHGVQCMELREDVGVEELEAAGAGIVPVIEGDESSMRAMAVVDIADKRDSNRNDITEVTHLEFVETTKRAHQLVVCTCDGTIKVIDGVGTSAVTVHTIRDVHDLRYKTWFKRESGKSVARREAPVIELVRVSSSSLNMAVVVLNRIFILNLDTRRIGTQIPSVAGTITGVEFLQDGAKLLVTTTVSETQTTIGLFDTLSGDMCAFAGVAEPAFHDLALEGLGPVLGIEATDDPDSAVLYCSHALVHINVSRQLEDEESVLAGLGRRNRNKQAKFDLLRATQGRNPRVIRSEHPILACAGARGGELVVVEGSYDGVWRGKMAPIKRPRYGE